MIDIRFRPMQHRDLSAVYRLEKICQPRPWPMWCFRTVLRSRSSCWVLEQQGSLLGFGMYRVQRGQAHIMNMCVAPAHRRQGLGRRIMLHLMNTARKQHLRHAWLEVRARNRAAISLYQRLGFEQLTIRKGYYKLRRGREDALVMACRL